MTVPTARAARDPSTAATSPYVITAPGGMDATTATTRETKSSCPSDSWPSDSCPGDSCPSDSSRGRSPSSVTRAPLELERADVLAVLGLADDLEADPEEEFFRALFARLPDDGELVEPAG